LARAIVGPQKLTYQCCGHPTIVGCDIEIWQNTFGVTMLTFFESFRHSSMALKMNHHQVRQLWYNLPLKKREGNWAELAFAKTSGTVT